MKDKKTKIQAVVIFAVVFVVYNILVFVLPFEKTGAFWLSYVFTLVAILAQGVIFHVAFNQGKPVQSKLYGFPIARLGVIYLVVQLVLGFVFMLLGDVLPIWVPVILFVVVLGAAAVGLIAADMMRTEVERQDTALKRDTTMMRTFQSRMSHMAAQGFTGDAGRALHALAEAMRYADPVTSAATEPLEAELAVGLEQLQQAVIAGEEENICILCRKLSADLAERNRICKLSK